MSERDTPIALAMVIGQDLVLSDEHEPEMVGSFQNMTLREFPFELPSLCVLVELTDAVGTLEGRIRCVGPSGRPVFGTPRHTIRFRDPLEVTPVIFHIRRCRLPAPGTYRVQFVCGDRVVTERKIHFTEKEER
jgi:hypothetical protein